jgi:hypothetical protein
MTSITLMIVTKQFIGTVPVFIFEFAEAEHGANGVLASAPRAVHRHSRRRNDPLLEAAFSSGLPQLALPH